MAKNNGGYVYPQSDEGARGKVAAVFGGKTLRQEYAAAALQGILSNQDALMAIIKSAEQRGVEPSSLVAEASFVHADSMLTYEQSEAD